MSILEQNSAVFREVVGTDEYFTEHHSNLLAEIDTKEELHEYELRTEKWDAPVIATTMVQFLNALFDGKNSSVRRMHRLANAVIIIDEVQSLPLKCVHLFNLAMNFLAYVCGATIVLCSATQPTVEQTEYKLILDRNHSMTGDFTKDFAVFRRQEVQPKISPNGMSYEEAVDFCANKFTTHGNLLLIVNTKKTAKEMFVKLRERFPNETMLHLSTNMCPAHRRDNIEQMKTLLKENKPLICVSTQLIEAGVDISFNVVVRSLAGLDSVAQAAGRCNRNGENKNVCPVYVVNLNEKNIDSLIILLAAQDVARRMIKSNKFKDYLANDAQDMFFEMLYEKFFIKKDVTGQPNELSFKVNIKEENCTDLVELLSCHRSLIKMSGLPKSLKNSLQRFKTAGDLFQVIDKNTQDVIVPYNDEARGFIDELVSGANDGRLEEIMRKAQRYSVSLYNQNKRKLYENGALSLLPSGAIILNQSFYDKDFGVTTEYAEFEFLCM